MNWTGGALQRHSRPRDAERQKQKAYAARMRLLSYKSNHDQPRYFVPEYLRSESNTQNSRNSIAPLRQQQSSQRQVSSENHQRQYEASKHHIPTGLNQPAVTPESLSAVDIEFLKRKLLAKKDWAGLAVTRPLGLIFSQGSRNDIGKRRRTTRRAAHNKVEHARDMLPPPIPLRNFLHTHGQDQDPGYAREHSAHPVDVRIGTQALLSQSLADQVSRASSIYPDDSASRVGMSNKENTTPVEVVRRPIYRQIKQESQPIPVQTREGTLLSRYSISDDESEDFGSSDSDSVLFNEVRPHEVVQETQNFRPAHLNAHLDISTDDRGNYTTADVQALDPPLFEDRSEFTASDYEDRSWSVPPRPVAPVLETLAAKLDVSESQRRYWRESPENQDARSSCYGPQSRHPSMQTEQWDVRTRSPETPPPTHTLMPPPRTTRKRWAEPEEQKLSQHATYGTSSQSFGANRGLNMPLPESSVDVTRSPPTSLRQTLHLIQQPLQAKSQLADSTSRPRNLPIDEEAKWRRFVFGSDSQQSAAGFMIERDTAPRYNDGSNRQRLAASSMWVQPSQNAPKGSEGFMDQTVHLSELAADTIYPDEAPSLASQSAQYNESNNFQRGRTHTSTYY